MAKRVASERCCAARTLSAKYPAARNAAKLPALPRLVKVPMADSDAGWLTTSLRFAATEAARARAGGTSVLGKLSELRFIEAVRRYIETLAGDERGWLAGLRDRFVGKALALLHARPAHPWTVDELGRQVGLSRSALAQRFAEFSDSHRCNTSAIGGCRSPPGS
jgi:hypothetical protein